MPATRPLANDGGGVTIIFATTSWQATGVQIYDASGPEITRKDIAITNYASTDEQFIPSTLRDCGEITFMANLNTDFQPPIGSAAETIAILNPAFGTNIGTTVTATNCPGGVQVSAYVKKWGPFKYPISGRMEGPVVLKCTGSFTKVATS